VDVRRRPLNYKWIGREDRLKDVWCEGRKKSTWTAALNEISDKLKKAPAGSVAIIASARQTNEELVADFKLKASSAPSAIPFRARAKATSCSSARTGIRTATARGSPAFAADPMGSNLPKIAEGIERAKSRR
jgi:hypothetical protein